MVHFLLLFVSRCSAHGFLRMFRQIIFVVNGPHQANLVLIAYASNEGISSESRGTFRQKARSLAPLNGWACTVKICHDGMLEDTNLLDGAQMKLCYKTPKCFFFSNSKYSPRSRESCTFTFLLIFNTERWGYYNVKIFGAKSPAFQPSLTLLTSWWVQEIKMAL